MSMSLEQPQYSRAQAVPTDRSRDVRQHLGHLDALRGIAILLVFAVHAMLTAGTIVKPWQIALFRSGQRGVELFYIVSAFTLFFSLDTDRGERHPLRNFYVRRFFRIAPLFYLAVIVNLWLNGAGTLTPLEVASAFAFLNGLFPDAINAVAVGGWSIAVETSFYLFLPLLFRGLRTLRSAVLALAVAAPLCWWLSYRIATTHPHHLEYFSFLWFPVQLPVFLMGIVTYMFWKRWRLNGGEQAPLGQRRLISAVLLVATALLYVAGLSYAPDVAYQIPWRNLHLYTASFVFVPLILAMSVAPVRLFDNAVTRFLGKISYSMYLSHFFMLQAIQAYLSTHVRADGRVPGLGYGLRAAAEVYAATVVLTVPLSYLLFRAVEQPGIRLGRRLIQRWEPRKLPRPTEPVRSPQDTPEAQF